MRLSIFSILSVLAWIWTGSAAFATCSWNGGVTNSGNSFSARFDVSGCPERQTGAQAEVLLCLSSQQSLAVRRCLSGTGSNILRSSATAGTLTFPSFNVNGNNYIHLSYRWIHTQQLDAATTVRYRPVRKDPLFIRARPRIGNGVRHLRLKKSSRDFSR